MLPIGHDPLRAIGHETDFLNEREKHLTEEIEVFEIGQYPQIDAHTECHKELAPYLDLLTGQKPTDEEVARSSSQKKQDEKTAALIVEIKRKERYVYNTQSGLPA